MAELSPFQIIQSLIVDACPRLGPTEVAVADALGLALAEPVVAQENVPPFANSAMDGFALRFVDTASAPVDLEVVGLVAAGSTPTGRIGPGQAMRIMTGAPLPPGADAVVMIERSSPSADGERVRILSPAADGQHIRTAGSDLVAGSTAIFPGVELTPAHLGVLASLGIETVGTIPRPRVGIMSTGDELVSGPVPPGPGQIRDSNRPLLAGLLAGTGGETVDLGTVGDDPGRLSAALAGGATRCHALVTTGGVSVGDFDHLCDVLGALGPVRWWQAAIKPAKPLAFGLINEVPVFALPGNPVSVMVSFWMFVAPALRAMAGLPHRHLMAQARLATSVARQRDGKLHLVPSHLTNDEHGNLVAEAISGRGSHMLASVAGASGLALVPDGDGIEAGGRVEVIIIGSLWR